MIAVKKFIQRLFDLWFDGRQWMANAMAFISIRIFAIEVSWQDVELGRYEGETRNYVDRDLSHATDLDGLLDVAKDCLKAEETRRVGIIDKCKNLLTLSSLLLAVVGALLPKAFAFGHQWMQVVFFIAAMLLMNSIVLLLVFFDVRSSMFLSLDQSHVDLSDNDLKKCFINDYLRCQNDTHNQTDYLVDLYKTIRFFFLSAFTMIVFLFAFNFFQAPPQDQAQLVADVLKSDTKFIDTVRGSKGDPGPKGDIGPKGDPGPQGTMAPQPAPVKAASPTPIPMTSSLQPLSGSPSPNVTLKP